MNLQVSQAYNKASELLQSPRDAEFRIIARVTHRLTVAAEAKEGNSAQMLEALYLNERLWSSLASDVALEANALPVSLKAKLLYLYRFTKHQSDLIREGRGEIGVLIDINRAVMRGLSGELGG